MRSFIINGVRIDSYTRRTIDTNTSFYVLKVDLTEYGFHISEGRWVYKLYIPSTMKFRECIETLHQFVTFKLLRITGGLPSGKA